MFHQKSLIPWLTLATVILLLSGGVVLIIEEIKRTDKNSATASAKRELNLLASLVDNNLRLGNYQHADEILKEWGISNHDVITLRLTASNGFQISEYQRSTPADELLILEVPIVYSYSGSAILMLTKDLGAITEHGNTTLAQLISGLAVVSGLLILLTWLAQVANQKAADLRKQEEILKRYAQVVDTSGDMLAMVGLDQRYQVVNPVYAGQFGLTPDDLIGVTVEEIIVPEEYAKIQPLMQKALAGEAQHFTLERKFPDGKRHLLDGEYSIFFQNGEVAGVVASLRDITERKKAEERIRTLSQAVEQSPVMVLITDPEGNITYVNSAFEQTTGYSAAEVIGKNPRILKSGETSPGIYRELWRALTAGKSWHGEFRNCRKDGDIFWDRSHIAPVFDDTGNVRCFLAVKEDVTRYKEQEEQILYQAHFDSLTNIPNRFLAMDRLVQLIKDAHRTESKVAVLFLDLDDFKKVNDSLGHEVGDRLLLQAAERLSGALRDSDTIGRLGGDEFIVLLGGLESAADASSIAENLLDCFRDAFQLDSRELFLTASLGIAVYPDDGNSSAELLRNADTAMYHSKEQGRNTYYYFTEAMNQQVSRRLALEEQLHSALERGEFYLCYQPLVDLHSHTLIGTEALLRWSNPALGEVSPEEFIPITEQIGLIIPIGQFVITEALSRLALWQEGNHKAFKMAVNLSPRQFRDLNLITFIEEALQQAGVSGSTLQLEITEGVLLSGHAHIIATLEHLSGLGISIAMDDFGTGFSSLSYLRNYPFDILKIDRSFVSGITENEADQELVNAAITMGHGLGLKVVAEGIEMTEQYALLVEQGCDFGQGYLFSKPVPPKEITALLKG